MINIRFKIKFNTTFLNVFIERLSNIFEILIFKFVLTIELFVVRNHFEYVLVRKRFVSISAIEATEKSILRSIFVYVNKCRQWNRRFSTFMIANFIFNWSMIRLFKISTNLSIISMFSEIITKFWISMFDIIFEEIFFLKPFLINIVIFVFDWISKILTMNFFFEKEFARDSIF